MPIMIEVVIEDSPGRDDPVTALEKESIKEKIDPFGGEGGIGRVEFSENSIFLS